MTKQQVTIASKTPELPFVPEVFEEVLDDDVVTDALDEESEDGASPIAADEEESPVANAIDLEPAVAADPVRLYLRQMGSTTLLTREGEIEIAQRIEQSEGTLVRAVLSLPHAQHYVLGLAERLESGELRLRDIVRDAEALDNGNEEAEEDDEPQRRHFLKKLARVRRAIETAAPADGRRAGEKAIAVQLDRARKRVLDAMLALGLSRRQIDRIITDLY